MFWLLAGVFMVFVWGCWGTSQCASDFTLKMTEVKIGVTFISFIYTKQGHKTLSTASWCLLFTQITSNDVSKISQALHKSPRFAKLSSSLSPKLKRLEVLEHLDASFRAIASSFFGLYFISSAFHLLFNSPYCRKFTILTSFDYAYIYNYVYMFIYIYIR